MAVCMTWDESFESSRLGYEIDLAWDHRILIVDGTKVSKCAEHVGRLPKSNAPPARGKNAFDFDWRTYTWTEK